MIRTIILLFLMCPFILKANQDYYVESFTELDIPSNQYSSSSYLGANELNYDLYGVRSVSGDSGISGQSLGFGSSSLDNRSIEIEFDTGTLRKLKWKWKSYFSSGDETDRSIELWINGMRINTYNLLAMEEVKDETEGDLFINAPMLVEWRGTGSRQYMIDDLEFFFSENVKDIPSGNFESVSVSLTQSLELELNWSYSENVDQFLVWVGDESDELNLEEQIIKPNDLSAETNTWVEWVGGDMRQLILNDLSLGEIIKVQVYAVNNYGSEQKIQPLQNNAEVIEVLPDPTELVSLDIRLPDTINVIAENPIFIPILISDPFKILEKWEWENGDGDIILSGGIEEGVWLSFPEGEYELKVYGILSDEDTVITESKQIHILSRDFPALDITHLTDYLILEINAFEVVEFDINPLSLNDLSIHLLQSNRVRIWKQWLELSYQLGLNTSDESYQISWLNFINGRSLPLSQADWLEFLNRQLVNTVSHLRKGDLWDEVIKLFRETNPSPLEWIRGYYDYIERYPEFGSSPPEDFAQAIAFVLVEMNDPESNWELLFNFEEFLERGNKRLLGSLLNNFEEINPEQLLTHLMQKPSFWREMNWSPLGNYLNDYNQRKVTSPYYGNYYLDDHTFPWVWSDALGWLYIEPQALLAGWIYSAENGWIYLALGFSQ